MPNRAEFEHEFSTYRELEDFSSAAAVTVSSGPDNGYNNCVAGHYPGGKRHSTTVVAIDNLLSMAVSSEKVGSKGPPHIGGHGDSGFMTLGCGQNGPQNFNNTIGTWNESSWGPEFDRLKPKNYAILTLLTCSTGAGEDGADLLYRMAVRSGKPVRGRTGLTYCGSRGISYEPGSTWQVATPTSRPNPIQKPAPHFSQSGVYSVRMGGEFESIDIGAIHEVVVIGRSRLLGTSTPIRSFIDEEARSVASLINLGMPFDPGGVPGGMLNVELVLKFEQKGVAHQRKLLIYNYSVAQDAEFQNVFYAVNPALRTLLE